MNESDVSRKLVNEMRARGTWCYKASDRFHACIPDIIGCHEGVFFGSETKIYPNRLTEGQAYELQKIADSGGVAVVVTYYRKPKSFECHKIGSDYIETVDNHKDAVSWIFEQACLSTNRKQ